MIARIGYLTDAVKETKSWPACRMTPGRGVSRMSLPTTI